MSTIENITASDLLKSYAAENQCVVIYISNVHIDYDTPIWDMTKTLIIKSTDFDTLISEYSYEIGLDLIDETRFKSGGVYETPLDEFISLIGCTYEYIHFDDYSIHFIYTSCMSSRTITFTSSRDRDLFVRAFCDFLYRNSYNSSSEEDI